MELDEQFQKFRWCHILLIHRSIGMGSASLQGALGGPAARPGAKHRFFPQLWEIRSKMTDAWGDTYGRGAGYAYPENRPRGAAHDLEPVLPDHR